MSIAKINAIQNLAGTKTVQTEEIATEQWVTDNFAPISLDKLTIVIVKLLDKLAENGIQINESDIL